MSIKIYSGYDEFKYEEPELSDCIEDDDYSDEDSDEESEDLFFYPTKNSDFVDSATFYVVSDLEDEENAEDISSYLGKFKKIYLQDSHKVLFCVS